MTITNHTFHFLSLINIIIIIIFLNLCFFFVGLCRISDHDRMRKAMIMMRKQRSLRRGGVNINIHANQEIMATQINFVEAVKGDDGDLNDILFDLYHAARAA